MLRPAAGALLLFFPLLSLSGCLDGNGDADPLGPTLVPGAERKAFEVQAREFDLVADREDPSHLALAFITPRADPVSPSWLAYATTRDAGETWEVRRLCGDPLADPASIGAGLPDCPHLGARLTSDPILLQLDDGAFLFVGVALRADEVTLFASRYERDAMEPTWTEVVSRSAFNAFPGAHMVPAPYQAYYNGKPNVMQATDGRLHIVWAADLGIENDAGPMVTTGIPFVTTSSDGGRAGPLRPSSSPRPSPTWAASTPSASRRSRRATGACTPPGGNPGRTISSRSPPAMVGRHGPRRGPSPRWSGGRRTRASTPTT